MDVYDGAVDDTDISRKVLLEIVAEEFKCLGLFSNRFDDLHIVTTTYALKGAPRSLFAMRVYDALTANIPNRHVDLIVVHCKENDTKTLIAPPANVDDVQFYARAITDDVVLLHMTYTSDLIDEVDDETIDRTRAMWRVDQ